VATWTAERVVLVATYVVLAAIGVVAATIESFLIPLRLPHGIEGLSAALAFFGNLAIGTAAGLALRTRAAATVTTAAWFVTIGVLTLYSPGGDVIMPGRLPVDPGVTKVVPAFLVFGIVGGLLALVITARYIARPNPPTSQM
jgi:hypothetical protein